MATLVQLGARIMAYQSQSAHKLVLSVQFIAALCGEYFAVFLVNFLSVFRCFRDLLASCSLLLVV